MTSAHLLTVLGILGFYVMIGLGLALLIANPQMPEATHELDERLAALAAAVTETARKIGEVLMPTLQTAADAITRLVEAFGPYLPREADPNPFPRFHLFRRTKEPRR